MDSTRTERSDLIGQRETISGDQLFNLSSKLVKFPNLLKLAKTSPYSRQAKKWKQGTTDPFSSPYFWKNSGKMHAFYALFFHINPKHPPQKPI